MIIGSGDRDPAVDGARGLGFAWGYRRLVCPSLLRSKIAPVNEDKTLRKGKNPP
jgi:hypothetical protein